MTASQREDEVVEGADLRKGSPDGDGVHGVEDDGPRITVDGLDHPLKGRMSFEHTGLSVTSQPDMKLIVYTPLDADDTDRKLAELLD